MECCDNRGFIVRVLSLLSNVILTSERAQVPNKRVLGPALAANVVDVGVQCVQYGGGGGDGVVQGPGDVDVAGHAGLDSVNCCICQCCVQEAEAVWRCAGGWIPLNAAIALLLADTGLVILRGQKLTRAIAVALDIALHSSEPLDTVRRGTREICCERKSIGK